MSERILVVDDDPNILEVLQTRLESHGYDVDTAAGGKEALDQVRSLAADLIITDLKMPGMDGLDLLQRLREMEMRMPTIFLTAHGSIPDAVRAMKLGAYDFLVKPYSGNDLLTMIRRALDQPGARPAPLSGADVPDPSGDEDRLIGSSRAMSRVIDIIDRVAATPSNVLILGESGTGKELAARTLQAKSLRAKAPYVVIDCGALPDTLLESELFGHRKGSFTSATRDKKGLLEFADGGTVFLDEIGNISVPLQTRMLRFLQNGELRRIGDVNPRRVDVRVIAATHRDLEQGTADGSFRQDLFYRLKVVTLAMPPLRERLEDVPELAATFLQQAAETLRRPVTKMDAAVVGRLQEHSWPGNVRELKHVIEAAVALARGEVLDLVDLQEVGFPWRRDEKEDEAGSELTALERNEREQIMDALRDNNWVQKRAAKVLGISGRVIHYKIKKYEIEIPRP